MSEQIAEACSACGKPLLIANLYVDDGCPCNSPRGVNLKPMPCAPCHMDNCVKPGHRLPALFGFDFPAAAQQEARAERDREWKHAVKTGCISPCSAEDCDDCAPLRALLEGK